MRTFPETEQAYWERLFWESEKGEIYSLTWRALCDATESTNEEAQGNSESTSATPKC